MAEVKVVIKAKDSFSKVFNKFRRQVAGIGKVFAGVGRVLLKFTKVLTGVAVAAAAVAINEPARLLRSFVT